MLNLCLAITIVSATLMIAAYARKAPVPAGVLKMIASTAFIALAVAGGAVESRYGIMVLAALFLSWWGDLLLIFRKKALFLTGLVAFFLGHLAFAVAFLAHGVNPAWSAGALVLLGIPAIFVYRWLHGRLGEMSVPVYAYMTVISIMVALAAGAVGRGGTPLIIVAAVFFYVSDLFVARDRFVAEDGWNRYIGLPLYYAAQTIFAYSVSIVA